VRVPLPAPPTPLRIRRSSSLPRAARLRLDNAEKQGRAYDQQLELLNAVRAYFAEHSRTAAAGVVPATPQV
jgi:hypothetical protein